MKSTEETFAQAFVISAVVGLFIWWCWGGKKDPRLPAESRNQHETPKWMEEAVTNLSKKEEPRRGRREHRAIYYS